MADTDSRVSAWHSIASDAALENIHRFLAGTDQIGNSSRRQRVPRDISFARGVTDQPVPVAVAEGSSPAREVPRPPNHTASVISSQSSTPINSYATAYSKKLTTNENHASSSHISSNDKPPARKDARVSVAPHLRGDLSSNRSQGSPKEKLLASIHAHSDAGYSRPESSKRATRSTYEGLLEAQRSPHTPSQQRIPHKESPRYNSQLREASSGYNGSSTTYACHSAPARNNANPNQVTSKPMNSGAAAKSAKFSAEFPCSYADCSMGFTSKIDLNNHKYTEHEGWCKLCDIDNEDNEALLAHKMSSLRHICCQFCAKDFHSEAARDIHEERTHAPKRNVKCIGCNNMFDTGSSLILHIYSNKCRDPRGQVRERTIRENRVIAAICLDRLAHKMSTPSPWDSQSGSIADETSVGGVPVRASILDSEVPSPSIRKPEQNLLDDSSSVSGDFNASASTATAGSDRTSMTQDESQRLGAGCNRSDKPGGRIIEGLESLSVSGAARKKPTTSSMAKALFGDVKPTPADGHRPAAKSRGRRASSYSASQVSENEMRTDWDHLHFQRDNITGDWVCPFDTCGVRSKGLSPLKDHLQSGYHYGTDNQCVKCLKKFDKVYQLVAHMESDSIRCGVKYTRRYGHMIHILSGGFLGVLRDEEDRPYLKEVVEPNPEAPVVDEDDYRDPYYTGW